METMKFEDFCANKINFILDEIRRLTLKKENIVYNQNVNLSNYGSKEDLISEYFRDKGKKGIAKIFKPSDNELKLYIINRKINNIDIQIKQLSYTLEQLSHIKYMYADGKFIGGIFPNDELIKTILEYSEYVDLDENVLKMLINLFQVSDGCLSRVDYDTIENGSTNNLLSSLEHDIACQFDSSQCILDNSKYDDVQFKINSLLRLVFKDNDLKKYEINVVEMINDLELTTELGGNSFERKKLLRQRKALKELSCFVTGEEVIKICFDINKFKILLDDAGFDLELKASLLNKMKEAIKNAKKIEEYNTSKKLLNKYLDYEELLLVRNAYKLADQVEDAFANLINHEIKNIISICRYISFLTPEEDTYDSLEVLVQRIDKLRVVYDEINSPETKTSSFYYLAYDSSIPFINELECMDITYYDDVIEVMDGILSGKINGEKVFEIKGIDFYSVTNGNIKLLYTYFNNKVMLVKVKNNLEYDGSFKNVDKKLVRELKRLCDGDVTSLFLKLQAIYEELVFKTLDLNSVGDRFVLRKRK